MGDIGNHDRRHGVDPLVEGFIGDNIPPPIAIVGMGLRLPGGVNSGETLWDLLIKKKDGRCVVPADRYNVDSFYKPSKTTGSVASRYGYFLQQDADKFDAAFFSMSKAEVDKLDPQQRLLLEVVWECMQNAGQKNWRGQNIGCYVGVFGDDWLDMGAKDAQNSGLYRITGSESLGVSNRISYEYNLKGPSMTIRTGCSSSLVAVHEACQALSNGDCTSAIVAGCNLILTPTMTLAMSEQGVLSPEGISKSFDAAADGYARGEGVNAVMIKPLKDALRDGDPIRAVIRATASNCDGKTAGITVPNPEAHEDMIRRAYSIAGIQDFSATALVECHATGTPVGDPLEASAVARVFGSEKGVYIGSIKPNVGHGEGASGISSLIKAVLALEKKMIPPNIHFKTPNPKIPFMEANLRVPVELTPWPKNQLERASVNSFGIGGANAHVILESAEYKGVRNTTSPLSISPRLLLFSSDDSKSLDQDVKIHESYANAHPESLPDLSYTLAFRRDHLAYRAFGVQVPGKLLELSPLKKYKRSPDIVCIFTGQGAQWAQMGKELVRDFPSVMRDIQKMQLALSKVPHPPSWKIIDELLKPDTESQLAKGEYAQPLSTAIQVVLVNILRSWGVKPVAVIGHSSGEIGAAYCGGSISADEAIIIAYYRGIGTTQVNRPGGMAAVGLGHAEVSRFLEDGVVVACDNSPQSVTLSGDEDALSSVTKRIKEEKPDVFLRRLQVEMAYHSHHMRGIGEKYESSLDALVSAKEPAVRFYSSVTGNLATGKGALGAAYWRENLESPVLFNSAVKTYLQNATNDTLFIEVGPHTALAGPLRQIFKSISVGHDLSYASCLERRKDSTASVLNLAGQLFQRDVPLVLEAIIPYGTTLTDLPIHSWTHDTSYWSETRPVREWRLRKFPRHELLGSRILEGNEFEPTWRNILSLEDVPWIRDHKIQDDIVFPAAGYVAMVGEASRQLTSVNDYSLRNVTINAALVLKDGTVPEIITTLRPSKLTESLNSAWYDFTISSYNGAWVKHCAGQVKEGGEAISNANIDTYQRSVHAPYELLKSVELNYGSHFQGLHSTNAKPGANIATSLISTPTAKIQDFYQLHPTSIDCCLQLFMIAVSGGITRHLTEIFVPTEFSELYIGNTTPHVELLAEAVVATSTSSYIKGSVNAISVDGELLLSLRGGQFSPVENDRGEVDNVAAAEIHWAADIDLVSIETLIRPNEEEGTREAWLLVEKLSLLCMVELRLRLAAVTPELSHLEAFRHWLGSQLDRTRADSAHIMSATLSASENQSSEQRSLEIESIFRQAMKSSASAAALLIKRVFDNSESLFRGKIESLETLLPDDGLTKFYNSVEGRSDCADYFSCLGHSNPTIRILEVGAGTGGTTSQIISSLIAPTGARLYSKYTYTDISSGFFTTAKERFKEFSDIEFRTLDITKDPVDQGFEEAGYDLIVAANVLHATPSLSATLSNVQKLLAPNGRLYLQELSPVMMQNVNFIMGILPGWWLGGNDNRSREPFISPSRWEEELGAVGLETESVIYDDASPYHLNANIVARPIPICPQGSTRNRISILKSSSTNYDYKELEALLKQEGYLTEIHTLDDVLSVDQDIISVLDLQEPWFSQVSQEDFPKLQALVADLGHRKILWLTKSSQTTCQDPRHSMILGFARTIRAETSIDFTTLELDTTDSSSLSSIISVLNKTHNRKRSLGNSEIDPDYEYALVKGVVQVGRYHAVKVPHELPVFPDTDAPKKLKIGRLGLLQSLSWEQQAALDDLGEDELEVKPCVVGLNFRDVLSSMGIIEGSKGGLGLEASGVVLKIGTAVTDFAVGDRIMIFKSGCFSTKMHVSSMLCAKIPDSITDAEAATMPTVYSTVVHSLMNLGNLQKGQTVLIQSACGGVGIAAIQLCQSIGASIYVSAGNEEKVAFLQSRFGIPRNRIFNSRNTSFLPDILRETNGEGVDLVLNSLSGDLLHASWKCVAAGGRFVELGKRDFLGKGKLEMDLFEDNRSFFGVDLNQFKPRQCQPLLQTTVRLLNEGKIKPIDPRMIFNSTEIEEAFRYMQKGIHIGKVLVQMPGTFENVPTTTGTRKLTLSASKTYLLVGGLGGLGRAISRWMVDNGARNFIYLSRTAGSEKDMPFIRELQSQSCVVVTVPGSVSNIEDIKKAIAAAQSPIGGVLQMSMVLRDTLFSEHSFEDWETVVNPKVKGTWNLHHALASHELDFFVLFSSISGIIGNRGQTAYAAANTFLDAFVSYRHGLGLAASCLDIGMIIGIGYLAANYSLTELLKTQDTHFLQETDLLDALQLSIAFNKPWKAGPIPGIVNPSQLILGLRSKKSMSNPTNRTVWKHDRRMSLYHNDTSSTKIDDSSSSSSNGLKGFMSSLESDSSLLDKESTFNFLGTLIGIQIYLFMMRPVEELDIDQSLSALGVDSLVTIEIRNWWRRSLLLEASTLEILGAGTIKGLVGLAIDGLKKKLGS